MVLKAQKYLIAWHNFLEFSNISAGFISNEFFSAKGSCSILFAFRNFFVRIIFVWIVVVFGGGGSVRIGRTTGMERGRERKEKKVTRERRAGTTFPKYGGKWRKRAAEKKERRKKVTFFGISLFYLYRKKLFPFWISRLKKNPLRSLLPLEAIFFANPL